MKMNGNTILITGGATGIGYALAEDLLALGNEVIICGRREQKLKEAKLKHPELHTFKCDVAEKKGREELFNYVSTKFPSVNILINNAGIQRDIDFKKGMEDLLSGENEIVINLEAPIYLTAIFLKHLQNQENPVIMNVSSGLAFRPMPSVPIYCATKTALHTYTVLLRQQLEETGIKVFEIIPPAVESELNPEGRKRRGVGMKLVTSETFAELVINGLEKDEFEIRYAYPQH
jgi:uncharacterized oxidoreductase